MRKSDIIIAMLEVMSSCQLNPKQYLTPGLLFSNGNIQTSDFEVFIKYQVNLKLFSDQQVRLLNDKVSELMKKRSWLVESWSDSHFDGRQIVSLEGFMLIPDTGENLYKIWVN